VIKITFLKYDQKNLGPFGNKCKCEFCGVTLKNEVVEILKHVHYEHGGYTSMYFCMGHLEEWVKKQKREFLLTKL